MKSPLSIHCGVMKDSHACLLHMCFFLSVHDVSFDQSSSMRMRGVTLLLITLDLIVTGRANKLEENRGRRRHLQVPLEGPPHNSSSLLRSWPGVSQTGGTVEAALSITANLYVSGCMFSIIACWIRSKRLVLPTRFYVQRSAEISAQGLVNFFPAVAYQFCLDLPATFTKPGASTLSDFCILQPLYENESEFCNRCWTLAQAFYKLNL